MGQFCRNSASFESPARAAGFIKTARKPRVFKLGDEWLPGAERFDFVFVDEEDFERYTPDSFASLVKNFRKYKDA
jgi:hypothetical protein